MVAAAAAMSCRLAHSRTEWYSCPPVNRFGVGSPRALSSDPSVPPRIGVEPHRPLIRGGTDGAMLTARGLPTPNLFTGGQEYHSVREWLSVQDMAAATAMIVELVKVWAEPA